MPDYRVPVLEKFGFQPSVKDRITSTALALLTPARGDRYILTDGADNKKIVYCSNATGPVWTPDVPAEGWITWVDDENEYYKFDGENWSMYLGEKGDQGTVGEQGSKGSKGDQGTRGSVGPINQVFDADYNCLIITL